MSVHCPYCLSKNHSSESRNAIIATGSYRRKSDQSKQRRFFCKVCLKGFSTATGHPCFRQKKRQLNPHVFQSLVSGISQRRLAKLLSTNRKTIARKLIFLGLQAHTYFQLSNQQYPLANEIEFDDLETFEHSKMKPLSVTVAVESGSRRVLGFRVSRMPSKGLLAERSRKKYGYREDDRKKNRQSLFDELRPIVKPCVVIKSDENPHYLPDVRRAFPGASHVTFKGRKGCVVGQGELKGGGFDPIFSLNHTLAMLRANIHRLFRRTWNTTKKPENLALQIQMYCLFHNLYLIQ